MSPTALLIETLDELIEIVQGVQADLEPVAMGWAAPFLERLADELRSLAPPGTPVTVAALYVDPRGPYASMPGVDCWDASRDARTYPGPFPVVAHPPCARWCKLAKFCEARHGLKVGADGGVFESALGAVRRWGGVLEHPAWSLAWPRYELTPPPSKGGWLRTMEGEWVASVAQSSYGHAARKQTWLLLVGAEPPTDTRWERPKGEKTLTHLAQRHTGNFNNTGRGHGDRMSKKQTHITPLPFAEFLVSLARSVRAA